MKPTETVLWTMTSGLRCVVRPYDETRYQLRLMWDNGTYRADLFETYSGALAAAEEWKAMCEARERGQSEPT